MAIFHSNLLNYQRVRLVDAGHQPYLEGKRLGHRSNGTQNDVGPSCVGLVSQASALLRFLFVPDFGLNWLNLDGYCKPCHTQVDDVSILKTDRQILQQVTCFFPLFGHPTTVSLPHLVLNSCLPSSRRLRW